jgi:hypothetical protein
LIFEGDYKKGSPLVWQSLLPEVLNDYILVLDMSIYEVVPLLLWHPYQSDLDKKDGSTQ